MSATYMRACAGKKKHTSKEGALAARRRLAQKTGKPESRFAVYPCTQGPHYHVGGPRKKGKRKRGVTT